MMNQEDTKIIFSHFYLDLWHDMLNRVKQNDNDILADSLNKDIAHFAMTAWNMSLAYSSYGEFKKAMRRFGKSNYGGDAEARQMLLYAAEIKWKMYRDGTDVIVKVDAKTVDGIPHAVAFLWGEYFDGDKLSGLFHEFTNTAAIREKLKRISPDKTESEEKGTEERDFPISRVELDVAYDFMQKQAPQDKKQEMLKELLDFHPFLASLCKEKSPCLNAQMTFNVNQLLPFTADTIPDIILAIASVYQPDTIFMNYNGAIQTRMKNVAKRVAEDFVKDLDRFNETVKSFPEPCLEAFLAETLAKFDLSPGDFRKKLVDLLTCGIMLGNARLTQHPDMYPDFEGSESGEETYDFDQQATLRVFYLHVNLRGYGVSVDLTAPENITFAELHEVLTPVFDRDDDHLYRFECEDGCVATRIGEEVDEGVSVLACQCYLGHHLDSRSKVYYLFDYGDCWEHDITVKKVVNANPKDCRCEVIKITGKIPSQYGD